VARSQKPQLVVQRTGTDNTGIQVVDYGTLESAPAVFRKNRNSTIEALSASGVDKYDIPAFLRKQAD
jgi:cell division protein FtsZ